jgi:hypothetical protein
LHRFPERNVCWQLEDSQASCHNLREHLLQVTADLRDVIVDRDFIRMQKEAAEAELLALKEQYAQLLEGQKAYVHACLFPFLCTWAGYLGLMGAALNPEAVCYHFSLPTHPLGNLGWVT